MREAESGTPRLGAEALDALEALAKAMPESWQGEWYAPPSGGDGPWWSVYERAGDSTIADAACPSVAAFIAAAHPATVLALVAAARGRDALAADVARLRTACEASAQQFEFYARQHRAKRTLEGVEKAETNERMAEMCRAALRGEAREG